MYRVTRIIVAAVVLLMAVLLTQNATTYAATLSSGCANANKIGGLNDTHLDIAGYYSAGEVVRIIGGEAFDVNITTSFPPFPTYHAGNYPAPFIFTVPTTATYTAFDAVTRSMNATDWTVKCLSASEADAQGIGQVLHFTDGRCNQDIDAPVAVFPDGNNGYNFYAVFKGVGHFAFHATKPLLDEHPDTGATTLIAENMGVQLFRLAGGGLQVNRNKPDGTVYTFNLDTCGP